MWYPRELTTEHLIEAGLRLNWTLRGSFVLQPISSLSTVEIWVRFREIWTIIEVFMESLLKLNLHKMHYSWLKILAQ